MSGFRSETLTKKAASGGLARYRIVTVSGTIASYASAGHPGPLYITEHAAEAGMSVTLCPLESFEGVLQMTCAAAVTAGQRLAVSGAAGKVSETGRGPSIAVALEDGSGDGAIITVALLRGAGASYVNLATSAEVENTTDETAFDQSVSLPADTLKKGDKLKIRARANVVDNNASDTLNLKLKLGAVEIAATGAVNVADADVGYFDAEVIIREDGAAGVLEAAGVTALGVIGTVTAKPFAKAPTAIDTTGALAVTVTATWNAAHADNEVELQHLSVEHIPA